LLRDLEHGVAGQHPEGEEAEDDDEDHRGRGPAELAQEVACERSALWRFVDIGGAVRSRRRGGTRTGRPRSGARVRRVRAGALVCRLRGRPRAGRVPGPGIAVGRCAHWAAYSRSSEDLRRLSSQPPPPRTTMAAAPMPTQPPTPRPPPLEASSAPTGSAEA